MALEFALRPRISLEQLAPRRRSRRARLPALVLPIVAYWLAMAGGTHTLLGFLAGDPADSGRKRSPASPAAEVFDSVPDVAPPAPSSPALATTAPHPPQESDVEPAPVVAAPALPASETERPAEQAPEPSTPKTALAPRRTPVAELDRPAPSLRRDSPAVQPRISAPELPDPFAALDDPGPRRREVATEARGEPASTGQPSRDEAPASSLPSCESAAAGANETIDLGSGRSPPDLTRDAFASVLENGSYLARCAIPARTALDICAAVRDGKVVGVSVTSAPRSPAVNACVRRAVSTLRFPHSGRLDVTRTRFEAAR